MKTFIYNGMTIRVMQSGIYGQYVAQNQDGRTQYTTNSIAYDRCDYHQESQEYFYNLLNH